METSQPDEGLKRVIGVKGLATTVVNNTIGAGIYVLPATVCIAMGPGSILAYVACGLMFIAFMLCYMEIGSKITDSGGSYIYVERAFGPFAGFIINWLFFFGFGALGSAAIVTVITNSLAVISPVFGNIALRDVTLFILVGSMVWVNVRGAKESVKFLEYITVIKIVPLVAIIIFGVAYIQPANLHWEHIPAIHTFGTSVLSLFFAFVGFETSLGSSGEIKDPARTVPRGVIWGSVMVFIFYGLINTVALGILGNNMVKFKAAPLAAVADHMIGPVGATILLIAAMISCFGNNSGDILATPRLLFAGARDGIFPKFLAKVHPKFATPYIAVIVYGGIIFLFAVFGGFDELAVLASGSILLVYLSVIFAMLKLRFATALQNEPTFKVPGGIIIPGIAIVSILWLLANLTGKEIKAALLFIAAICVIYFIMRLIKDKNTVPGK